MTGFSYRLSITALSTNTGLAWGDFDGDGDLGRYIGNHKAANKLLRNTTRGDGQIITDVSRNCSRDTGPSLPLPGSVSPSTYSRIRKCWPSFSSRPWIPATEGWFSWGQRLGFALEALEAAGIFGEMFRQGLDGHVAGETRVLGQVDYAHASTTDFKISSETETWHSSYDKGTDHANVGVW